MIGRLIDWSANNRLFVVLGALALVLGGLLALTVKPYIAKRFKTWGHAWDDPNNAGMQQTRAMSALASGGLFGVGAGLQVARVPVRIRRMPGSQIAHDGVGFPQHKVAIFDHRHPAIGVHGPVLRGIDHTKSPARINCFIVQAEFLGAPQCFPDV